MRLQSCNFLLSTLFRKTKMASIASNQNQTKLRPELHKIIEDYAQKNHISQIKIKILQHKTVNFLSEVWKLRLTGIHKKTEDDFDATFIIKELPDSNQYSKIFNCDIAFRNECFAYETILPTLQKYASKPLPVPRCIHSSKDVIVLEDLSDTGFEHFDKLTGFTIPLVKTVLSEMANIHAASLIMQHKDQKNFRHISNTVEEILYRKGTDNALLKTQEDTIDMVIEIIRKENPESDLPRKLEILRSQSIELQLELLSRRSGPFTVINHGDTWANNILLNRDTNIKLIDFQMMRYTSLAADLNYFLYVNLDPDFRVAHEEEFLYYYWQQLLHYLSGYNLPISSELTFDNLLAEIRTYSLFGFICGLWVLPVFYKDPESIDRSEDGFQKHSSRTVQHMIDRMCPAQSDRLRRLVASYAAYL